MGVYTWVPKYCCGEELQFQSKSHPTEEWGPIDIDKVPLDVANDIKNDVQWCPHCNTRYTIRIKPRSMETVEMEIVEE